PGPPRIPPGGAPPAPARGFCRNDEHAIHPAADIRHDPLHPPPDVDRALRRFTPRRILERGHRGSVADERHRAQGHYREEQERDDQPGTQRHVYLSSLTRSRVARSEEPTS